MAFPHFPLKSTQPFVEQQTLPVDTEFLPNGPQVVTKSLHSSVASKVTLIDLRGLSLKSNTKFKQFLASFPAPSNETTTIRKKRPQALVRWWTTRVNEEQE